jgi:hypothetical protein
MVVEFWPQNCRLGAYKPLSGTGSLVFETMESRRVGRASQWEYRAPLAVISLNIVKTSQLVNAQVVENALETARAIADRS